MRPTKWTFLILDTLAFCVLGAVWFYGFDVRWGLTWQAFTLGLPPLAGMVALVWLTVTAFQEDRLQPAARGFVIGAGTFVYTVLLMVFFSYVVIGAPQNGPDRTADTPENHLLEEVLRQQYGGRFGYTVLYPHTSSGWMERNTAEREAEIERVRGNLVEIYTAQIGAPSPEEETALADLARRYFEVNAEPVILSLASDPGGGVYVDYDYKFDRYFTPGAGGWLRWHLLRPTAGEYTYVSRPVADEDLGLVLVYVGRTYGSLGGEGDLYLYRTEGDGLRELGHVIIWMS